MWAAFWRCMGLPATHVSRCRLSQGTVPCPAAARQRLRDEGLPAGLGHKAAAEHLLQVGGAGPQARQLHAGGRSAAVHLTNGSHSLQQAVRPRATCLRRLLPESVGQRFLTLRTMSGGAAGHA